ncbi:MAG: tetratricopeptide repeat protein, partial [Gammaproteobacteria bacterium]
MIQAKNNTKNKSKNRIAALLGALLLAGSLPVLAAEGEDDSMRRVPTPEQLKNEGLFQEGMDALEEERLKSAIRAFSNILDNEPELHRATLELALAYYRSMRYEEAERLAKQVLDDPLTPPEVRVTILAFLAQVKRDSEEFGQKHTTSTFIAAGIMHDSNVNVGPTTSNIRVGDVPLTLAPDSVSKADNAYVGNVGFDHLYQSGRRVELGERTGMLVWQSGASVYWRRYHEQNDYDMMVASINTGPAVLMLRKWRASLQLRSDYITLAGHALAWFNTVNPSMTWQFNNGELLLDGEYTYRNYNNKEDGDLEGNFGAVGLTLGRYAANRDISLTAGARAVAFNADDDQYGYLGGQLTAGISAKSWLNGTMYARGRYGDYTYEDDTPLFDRERHDKEYLATLGFTHEFKHD